MRKQLESRALLVEPFAKKADEALPGHVPAEDKTAAGEDLQASAGSGPLVPEETPLPPRHLQRIGGALGQPLQWLACGITEAYDATYLASRKSLADAARYGRWRAVLREIETAWQQFGEQRANAFRPSKFVCR